MLDNNYRHALVARRSLCGYGKGQAPESWTEEAVKVTQENLHKITCLVCRKAAEEMIKRRQTAPSDGGQPKIM